MDMLVLAFGVQVMDDTSWYGTLQWRPEQASLYIPGLSESMHFFETVTLVENETTGIYKPLYIHQRSFSSLWPISGFQIHQASCPLPQQHETWHVFNL